MIKGEMPFSLRRPSYCVTGATPRKFRSVEPQFDSTTAGICVRAFDCAQPSATRHPMLGRRPQECQHHGHTWGSFIWAGPKPRAVLERMPMTVNQFTSAWQGAC